MEYRPDSTILRSASLSERCHRLSSDQFHTDIGPTLQQPSHDLRAPPTQTREVTKQSMGYIIIHINGHMPCTYVYIIANVFRSRLSHILQSSQINEILHFWPPLQFSPPPPPPPPHTHTHTKWHHRPQSSHSTQFTERYHFIPIVVVAFAFSLAF